jgi:hypothetical protein
VLSRAPEFGCTLKRAYIDYLERVARNSDDNARLESFFRVLHANRNNHTMSFSDLDTFVLCNIAQFLNTNNIRALRLTCHRAHAAIARPHNISTREDAIEFAFLVQDRILCARYVYNYDADYLLHVGAQKGIMSLCLRAIERGATQYDDMLVTGASNGHIEVCRVASDLGAMSGRRALRHAAKRGNRAICDLIRDYL